jgi:glutamate 5-kinase
VRFGADDVRRLLGRSTEQARAELGPAYAREIVHRDDLVVHGRA